MFEDLHEKAKEHIFWKEFNPSYQEDVCKTIYDLESAVVGYFYARDPETRKSNAQFVLVDTLCHNVNALMLRLRRGKEILGEDILVLQSFLQNLHLLVDGIIPDEPFGLNPWGYEGKYHKIKVALNDDGKTYRAVQVISTDDIPKVLKTLEHRKAWYNADTELYQEIREEYQTEIDLLENGQKITKWFKIEP